MLTVLWTYIECETTVFVSRSHRTPRLCCRGRWSIWRSKSLRSLAHSSTRKASITLWLLNVILYSFMLDSVGIFCGFFCQNVNSLFFCGCRCKSVINKKKCFRSTVWLQIRDCSPCPRQHILCSKWPQSVRQSQFCWWNYSPIIKKHVTFS